MSLLNVSERGGGGVHVCPSVHERSCVCNMSAYSRASANVSETFYSLFYFCFVVDNIVSTNFVKGVLFDRIG